ncbi:Peptidase M54 archaemetzincin [Penicillium mononematosum]|uniref:peptidase M54 n=1 Tax=Penicillium mononematosum TaxID=268346 RepID=UPI002548B5E5|nr:peptidase M54 [Penicillium mononematosum]KAJ6178537.1 Peptidase M54 archaemetzincin [Penicillium mononematosum]
MPQRSISKCEHTSICLSSSPHAAIAGFRRQGQRQRLAAVKADNRGFPREDKHFLEEDERAFPAPLLLPGDDLAGDPEDPQSFQEWLDEEHRNPMLTSCGHGRHQDVRNHEIPTKPPSTKDVQDYLSGFYHGLPVKMMPPSTLRFIPWEEAKRKPRKKTGPQYLGLQSGDECVRIRSRTMSNAVYGGQVNLDDLLDVAISILPKDAYALLILVDFDLYEDDEDEFVCGRAYGGSRVAVVSSARYNPKLDTTQNVERLHAWPASHCEKYISACASTEPSAKRQKRSQVNSRESQNSTLGLNGPVKDAVSVYRSLPEVHSSSSLLSALWLGRVCRTASHELGHCFGIAHCVYYACSMQGTASICEDARQPPYLCPVGLAKVLCATSTSASRRYRALLAFCERPGNSDTHFFGPFATWMRSRLGQINDST